MVRGRVQGVGYRWSTRRQAEILGVTGWVRNRPDGAVEAHLEGSVAAVDALVEWMRSGPVAAVVQAIELSETSREGFDSFDVVA